ncbi:hypothetical protein [Kocuria sp. TGY1127_2]|uniref:hypothetical protein n=1 Tax=Kocuria sp. TGY1127_2 TaxID=2711328 RepID=UPI0015C0356A|nr:hypothetical protein [Kocuria sp. TGY1127_2]
MNFSHQKQMSPLIAAAAAAALGFGTLVGASSPAQAAWPPDETPCDSGPTTGDPSLSEDSPWKQAHGTAPIPFSGLPAAGGPTGAVTQTEPGGVRLELEASLPAAVGLGPAPDGAYKVTIGNGVCGTELTAQSSGGILDISQGEQLIESAHGQLMVQVKGPLNPDPGTNEQHRFLDSHDQPADQPHLAEGGVVYDSNHLVVPADTAGDSVRNKSTGLPVHDAGTDDIPVTAETPIPHPNMANIRVNATYRDAETGEAVVVPDVAYLGRNIHGELSIQQGQLKDLPSGRYRFSFTDEAGNYHQVYVMLADANHQERPGESPLYDDPS